MKATRTPKKSNLSKKLNTSFSNYVYFPDELSNIYSYLDKNPEEMELFDYYFGSIMSAIYIILDDISEGSNKIKVLKRNIIGTNSLVARGKVKLFVSSEKHLSDIKESKLKEEIPISDNIIFNISTMKYYIDIDKEEVKARDISNIFEDLRKYNKKYKDRKTYKAYKLISFLYLFYDKKGFYKYLDEFIDNYKMDNKVIMASKNSDFTSTHNYQLFKYSNYFISTLSHIKCRIAQRLGFIKDEKFNIYQKMNINFYFVYLRILGSTKEKLKKLSGFTPNFSYFYPVFKYFSRLDYKSKSNYISIKDSLKLILDPNYISIGEEKLDIVERILEKNKDYFKFSRHDEIGEIAEINEIYNPVNLLHVCLYHIIFRNVSIQVIFDLLLVEENTPLKIRNVIKAIKDKELHNIRVENPLELESIEGSLIRNYYTADYIRQKTGIQAMGKYIMDIRSNTYNILYKPEYEGMFIPLKERKCVPEFDNDGISYDSEVDYKYIFAIGNINKYRCYDFEEVEKVMTIRDQLVIYDFNTNTYNILNKQFAENLIILTADSNYPNKERFVELLKKLINDLKFNMKKYFNTLSPSEKFLLKDFFLGLFYLGMLTRRWNPDDKEYPMEEEGTLHGDRDISEDAMSVILTQNYALFKEHILDYLNDKLKRFLNKIICMTKHNNRIEEEDTNSDRKILKLLYLTFEEKDYSKVVCQRISSNATITTGDYYLKELFDYHIPNFDINKMKTII